MNGFIKDSLQKEARAYVQDCLGQGIAFDKIEAPLGMMAELRRHFGANTTLLQVVGNDWARHTIIYEGAKQNWEWYRRENSTADKPLASWDDLIPEAQNELCLDFMGG